MDEKSFQIWLKRTRVRTCKLAPYQGFIQKELKQYPYLSAAQIENRLKEYFPKIPKIHSKTIYNYCQRIRKKDGITKEKESRIYQKVLECGYGEQAQVDFGVSWMEKRQVDVSRFGFWQWY